MSPQRTMQEAKYIYGCSTSSTTYTAALGKATKIDFLAKVDVQTLIARGQARRPQSVRGSVDTRTVNEIIHSEDPHDPIKLFPMPDRWYAQEARFVSRPNPRSEDDGWLLTYVFDEAQLNDEGECRADAVSELWIIDATTMREVVAKVKLPQRVPYGLHGTWFSEEEINSQRPYSSLCRLE